MLSFKDKSFEGQTAGTWMKDDEFYHFLAIAAHYDQVKR